jgi:hypothetical protein
MEEDTCISNEEEDTRLERQLRSHFCDRGLALESRLDLRSVRFLLEIVHRGLALKRMRDVR